MKKILLVFLCFLPGILIWGQATETLIDEAIPSSYFSLDKKIDKGFEPTSNFIQGIVFYSFKLKDRHDYKILEPTKELEYYQSVSEKEYFKGRAAGSKGFIQNKEKKSYFLATDQKTYESKDSTSRFAKPVYKEVYTNKPHYQVTTTLADKTNFEISFVDDSNCMLTYTGSKGENLYQFSQKITLGKTYQINGHDFKVEKSGQVDANTPTQVFYAGAIRMPFVLLILLLGALFCTLYFKFPNIRLVGLAYDTVRGKYYDPTGANYSGTDPAEDLQGTIRNESVQGEVTPFQALSAALSATVGLGNIAGVAIAITVGGPGATLWMIIAGFLGMAAKFAECTLGVKYREVDADGTVHGGPMYYLKNGFKEKGLATLGKVMAVFFAIMCVGGSFGGGNMFQVNQAAAQVVAVFGMENGSGNLIFGIITAILVAIVIIGGIKRIATVAEAIVPLMAGVYILAGLIIIGVNISSLPSAVSLIFEKAFSPDAAVGGFIGAMIAGFQRAAFSNEAGVGSAAIAHSAVRTTHAASEGVVALLEPFIDTVIICTMSALVIIVTGNYNAVGADGVAITSKAFSSVLPGFEYILTFAVVLFALSTMLSWSYYGLQAWKFLFGKSKLMDISYKIIFCIFIIIGSTAGLGSVVGFSDAMIFAMVFPNIIGVIFLAPVITKEVNKFVGDIKSGRIKAVK